MNAPSAAPLAFTEKILTAPIGVLGGYNAIQLGIGLGVVGVGIWAGITGARALYQKALGSA